MQDTKAEVQQRFRQHGLARRDAVPAGLRHGGRGVAIFVQAVSRRRATTTRRGAPRALGLTFRRRSDTCTNT